MQFVKSFNLFGVKTKQIPNDTGKGAPTTATKGAVGCQYMDTETGKVYKCTSAIDGVYIWEPLGGGAGSADISYFGTPYSSAVPKDGIDVFKNDGKSTVKLFLFETDNGYDAVVRGSGAIRDYTESTRLPEVEKITRLHIEAGVTSIGNYFMHKAFNLKKLTFENSGNILHLGDKAFAYTQIDGEYEFSGLTDATLNSPFMACPKLEGLTFNSEVKNIPEKAFQFCISLRYVKGLSGLADTVDNKGNTIPAINDAAFQYCTSLQSLEVVPNNVTLGKWVFILTPSTVVIGETETVLSKAGWKGQGTLCFVCNEWADQFKSMKDVAETAPDIPRIPVPESDNQKSDFNKDFTAFWAVLDPAVYTNTELVYKPSAAGQCGFFALFHIYNALHPSTQYDNYSDFLIREIFSKKIKITADVAARIKNSIIYGQLTEKTGLTYAEGTEVTADDLPLCLEYEGTSYGAVGTAYWAVCKVLGWGYKDLVFVAEEQTDSEIEIVETDGVGAKTALLNSLAQGKPVYMSIIGASSTARHGVVAIGYDKETDKLLIIDSTWEYDSDIVKLYYWCEFESIIDPAEAAYIRIFDFPEEAAMNEMNEKLDSLLSAAKFRFVNGVYEKAETSNAVTEIVLEIPDPAKMQVLEFYADDNTKAAIKATAGQGIKYVSSAILNAFAKHVVNDGGKQRSFQIAMKHLEDGSYRLDAEGSITLTVKETYVSFKVNAVMAGKYHWNAYYWD